MQTHVAQFFFICNLWKIQLCSLHSICKSLLSSFCLFDRFFFFITWGWSKNNSALCWLWSVFWNHSMLGIELTLGEWRADILCPFFPAVSCFYTTFFSFFYVYVPKSFCTRLQANLPTWFVFLLYCWHCWDLMDSNELQ